MKFKLAIMLTLLALLFIAGCDKEENFYDGLWTDGRVIGSVHGIVTDNQTNARMGDVTVTWASQGKIFSTITNSLGYYAITDLSSGHYEISFSGSSGYAIGILHMDIPELDAIGIDEYPTNEDFHWSESENMSMYMLNAGLTGMVYAVLDDETVVPAVGVTVVADFSGFGVSVEDYTVVTDANGAYTFTALPATLNVDLRTLPFYDGVYSFAVATQNDVTLHNGGTVTAADFMLQVAAMIPFIVQNNIANNDFGLTDDIMITFSKAMVTESFEITLAPTVKAVGAEIGFVATWADDVALTINPGTALNASTSYTLSMSGVSQDGNAYTESIAFTTIDGLEFLYTNAERAIGLFDEFPVNGNIEITFNMEIDLTNINGHVTMTEDGDQVALDATASADLMTLIIDPDYDLEPGMDYIVDYEVYSNIPGDFDTKTFTITTSDDVVVPGQVMNFALDMGAGYEADYNDAGWGFQWDAVANATTYRIYARDTYNNSDFVEVFDFTGNDVDLTFNSGFGLPAEFDYFEDDGIQTPLAYGTKVIFKIVAENAAGMGIFSDSIMIGDETAPNYNQNSSQENSANNSLGTEDIVFTIEFDANEPMAQEDPTFIFGDNGSGYVTSASDITTSWETLSEGEFTFTIPAGQDASGDTVFITANDGSGNSSADTITLVLEGTNFSTAADIDYNTTSIAFTWTDYNNYADDYMIYVKDDGLNPEDTVVVGPFATGSGAVNLATLNYPPQFDGDTLLSPDDGMQTPFLATNLTFTLVPRVGGEEFDPYEAITLSDVVSPTGGALTYFSGTAASAGADHNYVIDFAGVSEYIDTSGTGMTFTFEDNGDAGVPADVSILWTDLVSGVITIVIPANIDHSNDVLTVSYFDMSGNVVETTITIGLVN